MCGTYGDWLDLYLSSTHSLRWKAKGGRGRKRLVGRRVTDRSFPSESAIYPKTTLQFFLSKYSNGYPTRYVLSFRSNSCNIPFLFLHTGFLYLSCLGGLFLDCAVRSHDPVRSHRSRSMITWSRSLNSLQFVTNTPENPHANESFVFKSFIIVHGSRVF